jgi:NitT/TauT family transport system permease protein
MASQVEQLEANAELVADVGEGAKEAVGEVAGRETTSRSRAGVGHRVIVWSIQLAIVAAFLALWQYFGSTSKTQKLTVGTPSDVAAWLWRWVQGEEMHGLEDLRITLYEAAYGWILGVVSGIVIAVILASSKWLRAFVSPFVAMLNALPKIALAPLFILIYGQNLQSKAYFVAAGIFFITFYNVFNGLRSIEPVYLLNAKVLGANSWHLGRQVYAPSIVAWVMTSLRLTSAWALTGAVIAEYLGALTGMGAIVLSGQQNGQPEVVIGGIVAVAVVALIIDRVIVRVERRYSAWRLV